jgi:hypothetical protein
MVLAREIAKAAEVEEVRDALVSKLENVDQGVRAASLVLLDLRSQGWTLDIGRGGITATAPEAKADPVAEKVRVRQQELWKRDEQLRQPSVRSFVRAMEAPRLHQGRFVSIFDLMRDGSALADALEALTSRREISVPDLQAVIDPYVAVVDPTSRCDFTGIRLLDIWRYFRHTWSNQYNSTPGRGMMLLIRDRAAPNHPVIGIAALSSAIVQISERDEWIGWQPAQVLERITQRPTAADARWIRERLDASLSELYVDDLVADGLFWPTMWTDPSPEDIAQLKKESQARRQDHARFVHARSHKTRPGDPEGWRLRAETDLFRSKRTAALADLLEARIALEPILRRKNPSRSDLAAVLEDPRARRAIAGIARRAKAESVGTEIADLSVCGAIPPYGALLGGKLVSMLAVSPTVVRAYRSRYGHSNSEIASSMAGRAITRRSQLVYVGTTSLYGSGSSQYNRIQVPPGVLPNMKEPLRFHKLGRSKSYGTSHLSKGSLDALVAFADQSRTGRRINSIFGEGVNPKFRKVREALDALGWPSDGLLQHGRERIVYGVPLVSNLLPYLLGRAATPKYIYDVSTDDDVRLISEFWVERWLHGRVQQESVLLSLREHTTARPPRHGARVQLPEVPDEVRR